VLVVLVHHADAVGPAVDPQRPLSERGRAQAAQLAARAKAEGASPAAIWHSGKLRARQTAEAYLIACNPFAKFRMVRGLGPDDPPEMMLADLAAETSDVMLVGHMPNIPAIAARLAGADTGFPLHGAICFERMEDGGWKERWRLKAEGVVPLY
jgi:phosphohistidine phosphatase